MDFKTFSPVSLLVGLAFAVLVLTVLDFWDSDVFLPVAIVSFGLASTVWELVRRARQQAKSAPEVAGKDAK